MYLVAYFLGKKKPSVNSGTSSGEAEGRIFDASILNLPGKVVVVRARNRVDGIEQRAAVKVQSDPPAT